MEQRHLDGISRWFDDYTRAFLDIDPDGLKNILLKVEHTRKVCELTDILTREEHFSDNESRIASTVALLHDVGRFAQYRRWRTFRDSESENHARLSADIISEQGLLNGLPDNESLIIEEAVRFHNLPELPERLKQNGLLFLRMIRDADKLDIWRVFLEQYSLPKENQASAACLGLPDLPEVTPVCLDALLHMRIVRLEQCCVLNDFKLLQISWALDLQFPASYRLLLTNDYISHLASTLNGQLNVVHAIDCIRAEVSRRAA